MIFSILITGKAGPFMYPQGEFQSLVLAPVKDGLSKILLSLEETLMYHPCLHDIKRCPGTHESWVARDLGGKFDITWHFPSYPMMTRIPYNNVDLYHTHQR